MTSRGRFFSRPSQWILQISILVLMAGCLDWEWDPVPLGDPEKSRIDPWYSGLWWDGDEVWVFEPYDKRTWLVSFYWIKYGDCGEPKSRESGNMESDHEQVTDESDAVEIVEEEPEAIYEAMIADLRAEGPDCLEGELNSPAAKAWLTRIGKADFMTFEFKGFVDKDTGFVPDQWINIHVVKLRPDAMGVMYIDFDLEVFSAPDVKAKLDKLDSEHTRTARTLAQARRAVERVIRRNVDNNDLYYGELEEDSLGLLRIQPRDYDIFIGNVVPGE